MRCREKGRMLELAIYGLVGLATMLVIAFYFAYGDEFSAAREQSSFDPIDKPNLNVTPMIEIGTSFPKSDGRLQLFTDEPKSSRRRCADQTLLPRRIKDGTPWYQVVRAREE
jgi:hypothetical protein